MTMVGGAYVAISPDFTTFQLQLREGMAEELAGVTGTVKVTADTAEARASIDELNARLAAFGSEVISPSVELGGLPEVNARLGALQAELEALHADIKVDIDTTEALAKIAALQGGLDAATGNAGGGGGLISGLVSRILWGGGSGGVFGLGAGMAGFGSLGSLAGLGPEHALLVGAGVAGSATGAALGGGLLAAGALGTAAVGMGTDLAGIGQAAGDIKATYTAMTALNTAIAEYGAGSTQAEQAQAGLNNALTSFNPVAQQAVAQAAAMASTLHNAFDQATGEAEKTGAQILTQLGQVAEPFITVIGKFAAENMLTIKSALQPLFQWLDSEAGGLGIFNQLEEKFRGELPTAMSAFDNGLELIARTVDLAAQSTGGFMVKLDDFLTKMNGAGWDDWSGHVEKLIDDFHTWDDFITAVVRDIAAIFSHDAGTVTSLLDLLTNALNELHAYIDSSSGGAAIHSVFEAHKEELLAILPVIGSLIGDYGKLALAVTPALANTVTAIAKAFSDVLKVVSDSGPLGDYAIAMGLIGAKVLGAGEAFKLAKTAVSGVFSATADLSQWAGNIVANMHAAGGAATTMATDTQAAAGETEGALFDVGTSFDEVPIAADAAAAQTKIAGAGIVASSDATATGVDVAIGATGVGLVLVGVGIAVDLLASHWREALHDMLAWTSNAANFIVQHSTDIAIALAALVPGLGDVLAAVVELATHWKSSWNDMKIIALGVSQDAENAFDTMVNGISKAWGDLENGIVPLAKGIANDIRDTFDGMVNEVTGAFSGLVNGIIGALNTVIQAIDAIHIPSISIFGHRIEGGWGGAGIGTISGVSLGTDLATDLPGIPGGNLFSGGTGAGLPEPGWAKFAGLTFNPDGTINLRSLFSNDSSTGGTTGGPGTSSGLGRRDMAMGGSGSSGATTTGPSSTTPTPQVQPGAGAAANAANNASNIASAQSAYTQDWQQFMADLQKWAQDNTQNAATIKGDFDTAAKNVTQAAVTIQGDMTTSADDLKAAASQMQTDMMAIKDDYLNAATARVGDQSQIAQDASAAQVTAIQDASQIVVDKLAEQGQIGIALQLARDKVALDQLKAQEDATIAQAQIHADQVKAQQDAKIAYAQLHLDEVTAHQDALVLQAKLALDAETTKQDEAVARAQSHLDIVTLQQAQLVAKAQNHADMVAARQQEAVTAAQFEVVLADISGNVKAQAAAQAALSRAETAQTNAVTKANQDLATAQDKQTAAIAKASSALTTSQDNQSRTIGALSDAYSKAQTAQQVATAAAQGALSHQQAAASFAQAQAQAAMAADQDAANRAEAQRQKQIDKLTEIADGLNGSNSGGVHIQISDTGNPQEAAEAVSFRLRLAGAI